MCEAGMVNRGRKVIHIKNMSLAEPEVGKSRALERDCVWRSEKAVARRAVCCGRQEDGVQARLSAQCATQVDCVGSATRRVLGRILGNSFPAQLDGSEKVVVSMGHLRVSHPFSLLTSLVLQGPK